MAQDTGIDLAAVLGAVQNMATSAAQTVQKLTTLGGQEQNVYDDAISNAVAGTDDRGDTPLSKQTRLLGELEAQNKKADYYTRLGGGKGFGQVSNELSDRYTASLEQALKLSDSIKERESVGFLDNPLAYLWNQMILPDEKNALDSTINDAKLAEDGLQRINSLAQANAKTEEAYKQTLTTAAVDSQVKATQAQINIKADEFRLKAVQSSAHTLEQVMGANAQQLQAIHTGFAAKQSAAQLALSEAANSRAAAQFEEWKKQTVLTEQATQDALSYINVGADIAGKPRVDNLKLATILKTKGVAGLPTEMQALFEIGFNNLADGTPKGQLGGTTTSAVKSAQVLQLPIPDQVATLYNQAQEAVINNPKIDQKNKVGVDAAVNAEVKKLAATYATSIDPKNENNPMLLPSSEVILEMPRVQETALYKKLLAVDSTVGKLDTRDIGVLYTKGIAAVQAGKLSPSELSDGLITYVKAGASINNVQAQFERFGVAAPTNLSYNAKLMVPAQAVRKPGDFTPVGNIFTGNTPVTKNMLDKTEVDNLIISTLSRTTGHHIPRTLNYDK